MAKNDEGFDQRFETDDWIVKLEKQNLGDSETDVKSQAYISYKNNDNNAYPVELKFRPRSLMQSAKAVCKSNGLEVEDYAKDLQELLLEKKPEVKEVAEERRQYLQKMKKESEEDGNALIDEVIKRIYKADDPQVEDFADVKKFNQLVEANSDLILKQGPSKLLLTNEAKKRAEDLLGVSKIENVNEEALKVLEENPIQYILEAMSQVHKGDHALKVWELVSALSARCSDRQIHSWAVGPSGAGKSHIKRSIVKFLPEEAYEAPNSMTPKAMIYKTQKHGSDFFKGKLLFLDEAEGYDSDDAVVLLRGLTDPDEDEYIHEIVQDQNHEELIIEKPVTVWFTSVESMNDEQLKNRFILTNPDGSDALDDKVFQHQQKNLHTGKDPGAPPAEVEVIKEMLAMVRQDTAGLTPIVPFEVEWKQKFNRRLYPYFVTLMEVIAKMNYKNRVIKDNYIYVTRADFRTAAVIWSELIDTTIAQTDVEALKLIMALPDDKREAANTSEMAQALEGFNTDKVRRKADALRETEELQLINAEKDGGIWEYWAGADKDRLLNPEPEIKADPNTMKDLLKKTEKGIDESIVNSVSEAEVEVYDFLKDLQDQKKEEKLAEVNDFTIDLTDDEKKMLRLLKDMNFSADLKFVVNSSKLGKEEGWDLLETLEDKGMIKMKEKNGKQRAERTKTFRDAIGEGKITL